jgi:hypothetical protein
MIKLKQIVSEIKREERRTLKEFYSHANSSISFQSIINSNALPKEQTLALKNFFEFYNNGNIPLLNENTIRRIDTYLASPILSEGYKDWLQKVGAKAKDWLAAGWDSVKKVWGNFKDIISQLAESVKKFFKDLALNAYTKVTQLTSKLKSSVESSAKKATDVIKNAAAENVEKEWNTIKDSVAHLLTKSKEYISGANWQSQLESGSASPKGTATESIEQKPKLIFSKALVESLLILESGVHFEDLINKEKYPVAHGIVKWGLKLLSWIFSPIVTGLKFLVKFLVSGWKKDGSTGILVWINKLAEKLGGPKTIFYPILGVLAMELTEVALTGLNLKTHFTQGAAEAVIDAIGIKDIILEFIKQYVPGLSGFVKFLEIMFILYALGNFVVNAFPDFFKKIHPKLSLAH